VFTGLVEDVGRLAARTAREAGARLSLDTRLSPLVIGESIAVMGVCLTVDRLRQGGFEADASSETLARTTLGQVSVGCGVHLERAVPVGGRLGGHLVTGHIDCTSQLLERRPVGNSVQFWMALDPSLRALIAPKGSVTIDGVSLTVNEVTEDRFSVMIIPHTREATVLGRMAVGAASNIEADVLARYVVRWLEVGRGRAPGSGEPQTASPDASLMSKLASSGFL
jgi:riboflavin synthase